MNKLYFIALLFIFNNLSAQSADFILLKKGKKTIGTYYAGNHITFTTVNGASIDADITAIQNDTIYLQQFVVQQIPTTLGVYMLDTTGSYHYQYDYNEIKSINTTGRHFDFSASGASLMGGGILLAVASGVVYLADRKDYSSGLLIAGVGLAAAGYFIGKSGSKGMQIGKRYKLEYISTSGIRK